MPNLIPGLHHVTAIASDPQRNLEFYTTQLGLRFVKRTVNFDDPGSYHFYFGDDTGSPGTILTFFPWPGAAPGTLGAGETSQVAFSIPSSSIDFWKSHLAANRIPVESSRRFNENVLSFRDPDGMRIELVGHSAAPPLHAPRYAPIPAEHSIRGFFGVTLFERSLDSTKAILSVLGFQQSAADGDRLRFSAPGAALGNHIDLLIDPQARRGFQGAGSVHHIAFRAANDEDQLAWRTEIAKHLHVTEVLDRTYFHSIYFREPGGVLFELATDPPGFLIDEPIQSLGEQLRIPRWLEPQRARIEASLPPIELHKAVTA